MSKVAFVFFSFCIMVSATLKGQNNILLADQFVKAMSAYKFEAAALLFDPQLSQVNENVLKGGWEQITAAFGPYQSYVTRETDSNARSILVEILFANEKKAFSCNFNEKHQMVGFLLAAMPSNEEEKATEISRFREESVSIPVSGGTIKGTLMFPENSDASLRIALIIAGSGATDRNGNGVGQLNTNAYRMLAEALAEMGIASLRYDKRLVGESNDFVPDERQLRFEDYVLDAERLCSYLNEDRKAAKLYIIGHSEGSLIGMLAAQKVKTDAYVSLCGAGENIAATLHRQIPGDKAESIIRKLRAGQLTNDVPSDFQIIFRPSVQPYLISWMHYEPEREIKKLHMPILIVGGTTDIQVPVADAERLKRASRKAELAIIDGMNHILKDAPAERNANQMTYTQKNLPINGQLIKDIRLFLKGK